ncbi:hypothetical protein LTR53_011641, partial [Teratosphaeriaceae sp. CCFEE 6253]
MANRAAVDVVIGGNLEEAGGVEERPEEALSQGCGTRMTPAWHPAMVSSPEQKDALRRAVARTLEMGRQSAGLAEGGGASRDVEMGEAGPGVGGGEDVEMRDVGVGEAHTSEDEDAGPRGEANLTDDEHVGPM